jgi:hypothetical protein
LDDVVTGLHLFCLDRVEFHAVLSSVHDWNQD